MSQRPLHRTNVHCIWMDAGVTSFKLCDRDLRCDGCSFDEIMRRPPIVEESQHTTPSLNVRLRDKSSGDEPERILHKLFSSVDLSLFPDDRLYHRGHVWMQRFDDSTVTLGLDHVASSILGSIASIVLPQPASRLVQRAPWCWLIHREGALSLFSPFHGTVLEANSTLLEHPEYVMVDPYRSGWIVRAQCTPTQPVDHGFVSRSDYWPLVQTELREMRVRFAQYLRKAPTVGLTMMDGGHPLETLNAMMGSPVYLSIVASMFAP